LQEIHKTIHYALAKVTNNGLKIGKIRKNKKMSYNEKSETITKEEWYQRLEHFPFKQADMNRLIMNYLVTGKQKTLGTFSR